MTAIHNTINYYLGCLVGGAVGDALGAAIEFWSLSEIISKFGPEGISDYAMAYGKKGAITDDTQMTLFTAEGLILHKVRHYDQTIAEIVYHAYLRWLSTQKDTNENQLLTKYGSCAIEDGILTGFKDLHALRAPGNACMSALASGKIGTIHDPINNSKGCGGVMRIAPVGLFLASDMVFDTACDIAAITHGHPSGYLAAGCMAEIISQIVSGAKLTDGIESAIRILKTKPDHRECLDGIYSALKAWKNEPVSFETVEKLGMGWIAEEALAIGLYCTLAAENDFEKGIRLAVNHSGDSDSTGSIAGNILGVLLGKDAIPSKYVKSLELIEVIEEIAEDLFDHRLI